MRKQGYELLFKSFSESSQPDYFGDKNLSEVSYTSKTL
jgi:hypothetical protein